MFVCVGRLKVGSWVAVPLWHQKLKEAIFSSWELRDGMKTLEALLHICIYIYTYTELRRHIPHSCAISEKCGCAVTYKHTHKHTHMDVWWHAKIYSVCHITRGVCSIWWVVYRSSVGGRGKLWTGPGSKWGEKKICFSMELRSGWSLLNDNTDGVSKIASWRENNIKIFKIFLWPCELPVIQFLLSHVANPTCPSHEGFIEPFWKAFEYLTRVWTLSEVNPLEAITRVWLSTVWNISIYH